MRVFIWIGHILILLVQQSCPLVLRSLFRWMWLTLYRVLCGGFIKFKFKGHVFRTSVHRCVVGAWNNLYLQVQIPLILWDITVKNFQYSAIVVLGLPISVCVICAREDIIYTNNLKHPKKNLEKNGAHFQTYLLRSPVLKHPIPYEGFWNWKCVYGPQRNRMNLLFEAIVD